MMARGTPTHEPPDFPDDELLPEEPPPGPRQLLRMFLPVAAVIVVVVVALTLVLKFLVVPAMERSDPAVQARALATIGALQTQEVVTRAQQESTPQPTPELTSTPRPTQTVQPVVQPTAGPTTAAAAQPQADQAQTPTSEETSVAAQETAPTSEPVTDDAGLGPSVAETDGGAVASPTVDPVVAAEVQEAYAHYWTQRALAFRDLDAGLLADVAADGELASLTSTIEQLQSEGRAVQTHVIHHVIALPTAPGEAVIADEYEDRSIYVDPETKAPIDPTNPDPQTGPLVKVRKVLQNLDGVWKVTASVRYD